MLVLFRKIYRYIKWTHNYFYNHLIYWKYHLPLWNRESSDSQRPVVYISLRTNIIRDSITNLVFWFINSGYRVYLKDTFLFIGSMSKLDRLIFGLKECKFTIRKPKDIKIHLTNRNISVVPNNMLLVSTDYWREDSDSIWHIPEGMHPYMFYKNYIPDLSLIRNRKDRRIGVFFSGNQDENLYDYNIIGEKYNLLSRSEIIKTISTNFSKQELLIPENRREMDQPDLQKKIILNDRHKVSIPQHEYIEYLSNCNFFLYTPGVAMPLCRNNFESMAAGCIPILQYAHFQYPNLEHGKNCIVFENEEDLVIKINWALNLSEEEISKMRDNILSYYDTYIEEKAVIRNIENKIKEGNLQELLIVQG